MNGQAGLKIRDSGQAAREQRGLAWGSLAQVLLTERSLIILTLLVNAPMVLWYVRRLAAETDTHLFLSDYYWQGWSALWVPRWVQGSSISFYPALVQQLIPLLARPISALIGFFAPNPDQYLGSIRLAAVELAFGAMLFAVTVVFPLAVRSVLRIFLGGQAAGWAGLAAVCLTVLALLRLSIGQLASVAGLAAALLSLAVSNILLRTRDRWSLVEAAALAGIAGSLYHGPWLPVALAGLIVIGCGVARAVRERRFAPQDIAYLLLWVGLSVAVLAVAASHAAVSLSSSDQAPLWGIGREVMLFLAVASGMYRRARVGQWRALQAVAALRRAAWTLTVVLLTLWWLHDWRPATQSGLHSSSVPLSIPLYASDVVLGASLLVWCLERLLRRQPLVLGSRLVAFSGALVIFAAAISSPGSQDPARSLAFTAHLLLLAGFYLLTVNDPPAPAHLGRLFAALLVFEAAFGLLEAWTQSTVWLRWLHIPQLALLTAAQSGASVVGTADSGPWLRASGTFPHPNVLGGMLLIYLGAVVERHLATGRRRWLLIIAAGAVILFLTFSRSAWIGAFAMMATLLVMLRPGFNHRLHWVLAAAGLAFALVALWFWPVVLARAGASPVPLDLEVRSTSERLVLLQVGLESVRQRPLLGLGAGTFTAWVAQLPGRPAPIEPVHNVPLLMIAEIGLVGILAWLVLGFAIARGMWKRWRRAATPEAVWTAVLIGMLVASMADHYWWTMAPMRTMFAIVLALFAARSIPPRAAG